jgi:2-keto-3-deoxy-6-phosphogluconate aldolase
MGRSGVEIRIRGRIADEALQRLGDAYGRLRIGETVLTGEIADQAELQGALALLRDAGCDVVAVRRISDDHPA